MKIKLIIVNKVLSVNGTTVPAFRVSFTYENLKQKWRFWICYALYTFSL